ncbi:MAG: carboxypeptidase regulatory-like domain-containing protein [Bacteroidota bacterium]
MFCIKRSFYLFSLLLLCNTLRCFAQQVNLQGIVKDAETKQSVIGATATIYAGEENTILKYAFTNATGTFRFSELPLETSLTVSITHVGFTTLSKKFKLSASNNVIDLGELTLQKSINEIKEVTITAQRPPMVMHGDTLEINAEAFKTKENAVVEDLLRKVPGIVVWADGKITVNGKNISQLYVEGKPFFGGDPVIAIRNLPKDAVDKVKVYEDKSKSDPSNVTPQAIMDVILKKGMKQGFFGKAGGGIGTDKRREGNVALNFFSAKDQISVIAATNNTNKQVFNVQGLLKQTVYKPGGNDNTSYQSNFTMPGLNNFKAAGVGYSRDWSKTANTKVEFFDYAVDNVTMRNYQDVTSLTNKIFKQYTNNNEITNRTNQQLHGSYIDKNADREITIEPAVEKQHFSTGSGDDALTKDENDQVLNNSKTSFNITQDVKKLTLNSEYVAKDKEYLRQKFLIRYNLTSNQVNATEILKNSFNVITGASSASNTDLNRLKTKAGHNFNQNLYAESNLLELMGYVGQVNLTLSNTLISENDNHSQDVEKFNAGTQQYINHDPYLSNTSRLNSFYEMPGMKLSYSDHSIGVRDVKNYEISAGNDLQLISQQNHSDKLFQEVNRHYISALPSLYFRYNHSKEGLFNKLYMLQYKTTINVPTVDQLVPLIDSANQSYLFLGNPNLKKERNQELTFSFQEILANNGGTFKMSVNAGITQNKFADSSVYDNAGRRKSYTINIPGYQYIKTTFSFEKSTKLFANPFGIRVYPNITFSKSPYYIANEQVTSRNFSGLLYWVANYVQNDLLLYDIVGTANFSKNNFSGNLSNRSFHSLGTSTGINIQLSWPAHSTIVNSFTYDITSSSFDKTYKTLTWNVNVYYRLLKKEQLELKLTATDLLKQRTNMIRVIDNNMIRTGTVNNLQQFFMVSLSYYPRQFGFSKK